MFEEKLLRGTDDDKVDIGHLAEKLLGGQGGLLIHAVVNGIVDVEEKKSEENLTTSKAEWRLGRISGAKLVVHRLEQCISDRDRVLATRKDKKEEELTSQQEAERVYKGTMSGAV